jgi:hypothetical protein
MKPTLLLPHYFKAIGWVLASTGIVLGLLFEFDDRYLPFLDYNGGHIGHSIIQCNGGNNFTDEVATTLAILGLLFIGFSKFKAEGQCTAILRLKALYWAVLVNAGIVAFLMMDVFHFFRSTNFAVNNNLILLLLIFIGRLYYLYFKRKEQSKLFYLPYRPFSLMGKATSVIFMIGLITASVFDLKVLGPDYLPFLTLPCILLWIWSKEKNEREEIEVIRLKAMELSIFINCFLFIVLTWAVYGFSYLMVQFVALISVQLVFLIIFYSLIFKATKSGDRGKLNTQPIIS